MSSIIYNKINWQNEPSHATPLSAENLNKMDTAIYDLVTKSNSLVPNPVDAPTEGLEKLEYDGTVYEVKGGHKILNDSGSVLTQVDNMKFNGVYTHNTSTITEVEIVREYNSASTITSLTGEEAKGFQAIINGNSYEPFKATDIGFNKTGTSYTSDDVDGVLREVNSSVNALNKIWHIGQMVSGTPLTIQCNNFHAILLFGLFQEAGSKFLIVSRSSDTVAVKDVVSGSDFSNAKYTFSVSGSNVVITTTSSAQTTLMWARTEGLL